MRSNDSWSGFISAVVRRRTAVITCLIAVPVLAAALSLSQQRLYQANAQVLLSRQNLANEVSGVPDNLALTPDFTQIATTQAALAHTTPVARATLARLGITDLTPAALLTDSAVTSSATTDFLTFSVTNQSPSRAESLATAMSEAFVHYQVAVENAPLASALRQLTSQLSSKAGRANDTTIRDALRSKQAQLQELETLQTSTAYVAQRAVSASLIQPRLARNVAAGIVLGIILGLAIALLWDAIDNRATSSDEVAALLRTTVLGRVPSPPSSQVGEKREITLVTAPGSASAEALRMLAVATEFAALSRTVKIIACVSGMPGEGKTTVASELGVAFAARGSNVVVVDLDLRKPRIAAHFTIPSVPGVSDVVVGTHTVAQASTSIDAVTPGGTLYVIPAGTRPPAPGDFVTVPRLGEVIASLAQDVDFVLLDTPPILGVSDTASILRHVHAAVVVARLGIATRKSLIGTSRALEALDVTVLGTVVTAAEREAGFASSYGYYGSYGYEPVDTTVAAD